jgi:hypothetical protein
MDVDDQGRGWAWLEGLWVVHYLLLTHSPTSHGGEEDVFFFAQVGIVFKSKWRGDFACLSLHWQVIKKKKQRL